MKEKKKKAKTCRHSKCQAADQSQTGELIVARSYFYVIYLIYYPFFSEWVVFCLHRWMMDYRWRDNILSVRGSCMPPSHD